MAETIESGDGERHGSGESGGVYYAPLKSLGELLAEEAKRSGGGEFQKIDVACAFLLDDRIIVVRPGGYYISVESYTTRAGRIDPSTL